MGKTRLAWWAAEGWVLWLVCLWSARGSAGARRVVQRQSRERQR